jgi:THAP domain
LDKILEFDEKMSQINLPAGHYDSISGDDILLQHNTTFASDAMVAKNKNEVCCVPTCMSGKRKNGHFAGVSFHVFPTGDQPQRRLKWLQLLGINSTQTKGAMAAMVCSRHFDKNDFFLINSAQKGGKRHLNKKWLL